MVSNSDFTEEKGNCAWTGRHQQPLKCVTAIDHCPANAALGERLLEAVCKLGLEGVVSKRLYAPYRSGPSKTWIKVKNPKAPAATRAQDGTF